MIAQRGRPANCGQWSYVGACGRRLLMASVAEVPSCAQGQPKDIRS